MALRAQIRQEMEANNGVSPFVDLSKKSKAKRNRGGKKVKFG